MGDINSLYEAYTANNRIDPKYYEKFNVKRGLRNPDGSGVMAGVTNICNVHGYAASSPQSISWKISESCWTITVSFPRAFLRI